MDELTGPVPGEHAALPGRRQGLWRRWRSFAESIPLRVTLVVVLLGITGVAELTTGTASARVLRGYLEDRRDDQLAATTQSIIDAANNSQLNLQVLPIIPGEAFLAFVLANGQVRQNSSSALAPKLPDIDVQSATERGPTPFTVESMSGRDEWRVMLTVVSGSTVMAVALPLAPVEATVARLSAINLVVSFIVLLLLAGVAYALVRSSLRPLVAVERTAEAIASGQLSRRVPERDPRTEVGRLTAALNGMLGRIESAFAAKAASERAARESEDRMRRFIADASHELRTPLTSIRGFAELHRHGGVAPTELPRVMRRVEEEATRMGLLVDDLLLLARLDQQRPLTFAPVDLLPIATDAVGDARALVTDHDVKLSVVAGEPPVVLGDEQRLRQIVTNLVSNALRHTPPGTSVTVGLRNDGDDVLLDVADTGPGMSPEEAERVFERFYRADPARSRAQGGSGLGLSIVAALVAAHSGSVAVTTRAGEGATFRVRLPRLTMPPEVEDAGTDE